jgi:hypothetical protein
LNRIVQAHVEELRQQLGSQCSEEDMFERFAASITIELIADNSIDLEDVMVDKAQADIDGAAILVNGSLVQSIEDIEACLDSGRFDIDFVFLQAKTSTSFEVSKFGSFCDFANRFFEQDLISTDGTKVRELYEAKDYIFKNAKHFKHRRPNLYLFYVSTGAEMADDPNFSTKRARAHSSMRKMELFDQIEIAHLGASEIQRRWRKKSSARSQEIYFPKRVTLPEVENVSQSYLGIIEASEFLKLIQNDSGQIISSIFYDNVRDWQGFNGVNTAMKDALENPEQNKRFGLMNNGITVIAKSIRLTGDKLVVEDYQIVNGCQTSNVIWHCKDRLGNATVPIKFVATDDDQIVRQIIKSTNSQTAIDDNQLLASTDFQKTLEEYFKTHRACPLYFERRSKQYENGSTRIESHRIVNPVNLIRAYTAIVLDKPHQTVRGFRAILDEVGKDFFVSGHKPAAYYLAATIMFWIDLLIKKNRISKQQNKARFHIAMATKYALGLSNLDPLKFDDKQLVPALKNFQDIDTAYDYLSPIALRVAELQKVDDAPRTAGFTTTVKQAYLRSQAD